MVQLNVYKNTDSTSAQYGKAYARVDYKEMYDVSKLAKHMSEHNTPFSEGTIRGILTDMVKCIRHLLLDGTNVKIDDLAIFKAHIESSGSATLLGYDLGKNVKSIRLISQATGQFTRAELTKAKSKLTYGTKTKADREAARQAQQSEGGEG